MLVDMQEAKIDHTCNLTLIITPSPKPLEINIFPLHTKCWILLYVKGVCICSESQYLSTEIETSIKDRNIIFWKGED